MWPGEKKVVGKGSDSRSIKSISTQESKNCGRASGGASPGEVGLAELQDFIFINDMRVYLEHSMRSRLAIAYVREHWAEIMAEVPAVT
jgi:hypothetical protein